MTRQIIGAILSMHVLVSVGRGDEPLEPIPLPPPILKAEREFRPNVGPKFPETSVIVEEPASGESHDGQPPSVAQPGRAPMEVLPPAHADLAFPPNDHLDRPSAAEFDRVAPHAVYVPAYPQLSVELPGFPLIVRSRCGLRAISFRGPRVTAYAPGHFTPLAPPGVQVVPLPSRFVPGQPIRNAIRSMLW